MFRISPQQAFVLGRGAERPLVSQCALILDAAPDAAALKASLDAVVARHEILRTTFVTPIGARAPVGQTIHEGMEPAWLAGSDSDAALPVDPASLGALADREAQADFDLEHGPPLRVRFVELSPGRSVIVLTALAACADASSLLAIARELCGRGDSPSPDPIQHADYAAWRRELIAGEDPDAASGRTFWREAIDDTRTAPPLLFGAGAPAPRSAAAPRARIPLVLESGEVEALRASASASGVDLAVFVEAAWHALLARLSGASELLVAGWADGRAQPDLAGAIGPYEQWLPVRVRIDAETRFGEVLDQVRRARAEAVRWQEYGSDIDLLGVSERAVAAFSAIERSAPGVASLSVAAPGCAVWLDWRGDEAAELCVDTAVYDQRDAEDIAGYFRTLLLAAVSEPAEVVSRLALLDAGARMRVLRLGDEPAIATAPECVHLDFERQAARTPDRPAVAGGGEELTFGELNEGANRLAHHLLAQGAGSQAPVGLCLRRSPAMLTAVLGILKSGAAYLPLNFAHPPDRIGHQLAEAGAEIVVTEASLLDRLPLLAAAGSVCVDRDETEIAGRSSENPPGVSEPGDLAYVMYTSGSTGLPKGVAVTHGNLASYTQAIGERIGAQPGWRFGVVSEISTDLGNTAIFPPLCTGGCVDLIDPETAMDGMALSAYALERPIAVIKITPTHLRALLAAGEGFLPQSWLVLGGEALSWELVQRLRDSGAGCRILNHYGPTETTVGCCTFEVPPGTAESAARSVPIGSPLPGTHVYVLDHHREPVPVGVGGELFVGGAGVARGYVNRPQETADRFVADELRGGRMYRTGDRARWLRDGTVEFLGRVDDQVKIRGFRVEPGEVEAAILRHSAVREAAVVARSNGDRDLHLVAYVVAFPEPTLAELQEFLGRSLPEHMMPARLVAIDALPLTPSGKVDRHALPDPSTVPAPRSAAFVAPRDELEQEIAGVWSQLLGVAEVGVMDDFFGLGGHSLLATQAIMRIRRRHGNIPLGALFNSPTVAALAEAIRGSREQPPDRPR